MILGPLNARSQRASNAPNPIDFHSLKPEETVREVDTMQNVVFCTLCAMIFVHQKKTKLYSPILEPHKSGRKSKI